MSEQSLKGKRQYFRELDELGRVVPPVALRKKLHIEPGDALEFWLDGQTIVMQKAQPVCVCCGQKDGLVKYKEVHICSDCINALKEM